MEIRLLGDLEVEVSGECVRFEGVKQRRLFAVLALRAPEAVSADELVKALLAGASAELHEQIGAPPWESVTAIQARALTGTREALGSRYAVHLAEGRRLSAEEAVARLQSGSAEVAETSA